jgi:hypothetical protein
MYTESHMMTFDGIDYKVEVDGPREGEVGELRVYDTAGQMVARASASDDMACFYVSYFDADNDCDDFDCVSPYLYHERRNDWEAIAQWMCGTHPNY